MILHHKPASPRGWLFDGEEGEVISVAHVLDLKDGSFVVPMNLFDALDTVEDYMGVDMRLYLEEYFAEDVFEEESIDDHYVAFLEALEDMVMQIKQNIQRRNYKDVKLLADNLEASIRHEIGGK